MPHSYCVAADEIDSQRTHERNFNVPGRAWHARATSIDHEPRESKPPLQ